ncbi:thiosulfate sulfurtransferase [Hahella sp. CCB-MM4]|uniref:sulfurtransferase n=1 Tax=Hahella sp. (strain CCB-MM4) TaxID=1926491 RepID=UPI000B9B389D|nr:rhodanese-like domain-containing protein [Hahella sp. CCB-MM4]OZG71534.1 thiosulfate sulfurtransferase [Hahella sp. CCB-MM4]
METAKQSLPFIIEPADLEPLLGRPGILILDLCRPENYQTGHIPGAIYVPPGATQLGRPPAPGALPSLEQLHAIIEHIGLSQDDQVVVYDDEGGGWAGRMIWLLNSIGFYNCSYLNGGLVAWREEERPLTDEIPEAKSASYSIQHDTGTTVEVQELIESLGTPDLAIWDARSPMEYAGQRQTAARNGHIPGAVNYEWTRAMDPANGLRLRPLDTIRQELSDIGIDASKNIVTHCQTHHRSGLTYLIGKALQFNIRAYAGSWGEWGNHPDTPIEV